MRKRKWSAKPQASIGIHSPIKSLSLSLQGIHHIHGSHSLTTSVLGVGDTVTDNVFQKDLIKSSVEERIENTKYNNCPVSPMTLKAGCGQAVRLLAPTFKTPRVSSQIRPEIRLTPPRRARRRTAESRKKLQLSEINHNPARRRQLQKRRDLLAGLVIPWMLSRSTLR